MTTREMIDKAIIEGQNIFICPVKSGQTVYIVEFGEIIEYTIDSVTFYGDGSWMVHRLWRSFGSNNGWGTKVFPTRDAAQEALKKKLEEQNAL